MSGHTPGPWDWQIGQKLGDAGTLFGRAGVTVLDHAAWENMWFGAYGRDDENAANARLIASAPDLLEQLEFAVKLLGALPAFSGCAQVESMRAAIAKATGGE